ncbi:glycosyltransferase [Alteromonas sp. ASW11-36]|uniref:Glycosyltransferase n=1 Tax=Alteromonas arenosi TaxID=3055817 RepID=A0ABT7STW0_9ALTE|nr:glycosyltransferase [Alteromonas sp. ASW11-36]MDM7859631.1 glycosyltransferase [Alteromonas sp. ASW11-36]
MRIVHIASGDIWAGAEVQIYTLLTALQQQEQHEITAILLNDGELAKNLRAKGIVVEIVDETSHGFLGLLWQVRRLLKLHKPEVVHTHRQKEHILGSLANLLSQRAKSVRTVHGALEFKRNWKQKVQYTLDVFCGRYLQDAVIAVSDVLAEKLAQDFKPAHIQMITNGISPTEVLQDAASFTPTLNNDTSKKIAFVGRIEPVKRLDLFLGAAERLLAHGSTSYQFHIFGDGSLRSAFMAQIAKSENADKFIFHGHTTQIRAWINVMDCIVMPSDHEGLPMTALECLALQTKIVAHSVGGLVPLLSAGFPTGLNQDHSAMGYQLAVEKVLKDTCSVTFPDEYHAARNAAKTLALYQNL